MSLQGKRILLIITGGIAAYKMNHLVRDFIKKDAEAFLQKTFGWEPFQHKHHESRFTRFFEDFWLPRKFGFDKRKAHLSSLILTGQLSREAALDRIKKPELSEEQLHHEFLYVADKLDLKKEDLQKIFEGQNKTYRDYKNRRTLIGLGTNVMRVLGMEKRLFR